MQGYWDIHNVICEQLWKYVLPYTIGSLTDCTMLQPDPWLNISTRKYKSELLTLFPLDVIGFEAKELLGFFPSILSISSKRALKSGFLIAAADSSSGKNSRTVFLSPFLYIWIMIRAPHCRTSGSVCWMAELAKAQTRCSSRLLKAEEWHFNQVVIPGLRVYPRSTIDLS